MRIYMSEDYQAMSRRAANIISAQVIYKPLAAPPWVLISSW